MNQLVTFGNDRQFVPLGKIDGFDRNIELRCLLLAVGRDDNFLATLGNDAAPLLVVQHSKERWIRVDIGLVSDDDPVAALFVVTATVLDARVVIALETELTSQLEIAGRSVPDQELVVFEMIG